MTTNTVPLCIVPYYTIELTPSTGTRPCCKYVGKGPYTGHSLDGFYSEHAVQWRKENFEGDTLSEECRACKGPADSFSYNQYSRNLLQSQLSSMEPVRAELRKVIIGLDNICASSCVMCGPHFSSTIANLLNQNKIHNISFQTLDTQGGMAKTVQGEKYTVTDQLDLDQLDQYLDTIEVVQLFGGEPLLSPNLPKLVEKLKKAPRLNRISFTTGLLKIKETHLKLLKSLPKVKLSCNISLDGPLDLNEWSRGISPQEFIEKYQLVKRYIHIAGFVSTIGAYNVFALPELVNVINGLWKKINPPDIVSAAITNPTLLAVQQLPQAVKQQAKEKLENYLKTDCPANAVELITTGINLCQMPQTEDWNNCVNYMHMLPHLRGNNETIDHWLNKYLAA